MASKNKLGVYFGFNSLSIVETQKLNIINYFEASHSLFDESQRALSQNLPDEVKLTAIIQKSLRDNKMTSSEVNLSLPPHEIILRSFFIPWMTSAEIKGAVDFEARRYIPFKLEELAYGYYSTTVTEKKNRRIRILFIAIRKIILDKYCSIMTQSGLRVIHAEPASLCFIRLLNFKKQILQQKKYVIMQLNNTNGTVIIVEQGIPQLQRDFRLASDQNTFSVNPQDLLPRMISETRISLDYYRRIHSVNNVDEILCISNTDISHVLKTLENEFEIPVKLLSLSSIIPADREITLEGLNAYGTSLRDEIAFPVKIDLLKPQFKEQLIERPSPAIPLNYLNSIKVAVVCGLLTFLVFIFSGQKIAGYKGQQAELTKKIGIYEAFSTEQIKQKQQAERDKMEAYKNVRIKSDVSVFLNRIPDLLPDGAWLTQLKIGYSETTSTSKLKKNMDGKTIFKPSIVIEGYVYTSDSNQEIILVNNLLANLRNDKEFSTYFENIILASARKETLDENITTRFQINCD